MLGRAQRCPDSQEACSTSQSSAPLPHFRSRAFRCSPRSVDRHHTQHRRPHRLRLTPLLARKEGGAHHEEVGTLARPAASHADLLAAGAAPSWNSSSSSGSSSSSREGEASAPGEVLIELRGVHKSFGGKAILRGVDIKVRRGEAVGIIGGSGTGKSTTLRLMAGLLAPDKGEVRILGKTRHGLLADDPALAEQLKVGMVFQNGALFDSLTVGENVGFLLYEHTQLPRARIGRAVAESLASVGLSGVEALLPSELSGGMRKRVALARAIVRDDQHTDAEQVIMYDEPTAGLDPVASTVVEDLIRSLHVTNDDSPGGNGAGPRAGIASYIVVTHQHSTIRRAVDRLIFLHEGKVVWEGTVHEFDHSDEPIVRQFASGSLAGPIRYE